MIAAEGMEDEEKWLAEGIAAIQHNAFYMSRALVTNFFLVQTQISLNLNPKTLNFSKN